MTLPDTLLEIGNSGIDFCYLQLDEFILPRSITKIDIYAFSMNSIKSFVIGENVEYIGYGAFSHNLELESIKVNPINKHFASVNGALYSYNMTILYCIPYLSNNYKIPFTVTDLLRRSICQERATTLWIPSSISTIDMEVFFLIPNVNTIHFLGNIEKISSDFVSSLVTKLQSIVYHGAKIYNDASTFTNLNDIKVYVCKEYPNEYFGGKKVVRFGSCYRVYRTCKIHQKTSHDMNHILLKNYVIK